MGLVPMLLLGAPVSVVSADDLPKPFAFSRYQAMMDRSPFAVATAVAAPASTPNFAKDLYVASAAKMKEGDLVTIASSTDKNFKKYLTSSAAVDGYAITGIEWSDKVGATKVTISKDGQSATLSFNEALLRQPGPGQPPQQKSDSNPVPPPVPPPAAATGAAPAPGAQPNAIKPMPVPQLPTPPPRVRGVIPRNPAANAPAAPPTKEPEL